MIIEQLSFDFDLAEKEPLSFSAAQQYSNLVCEFRSHLTSCRDLAGCPLRLSDMFDFLHCFESYVVFGKERVFKDYPYGKYIISQN